MFRKKSDFSQRCNRVDFRPRKTFLLIQKFHEDTEDHLSLPHSASAGNQGEGAQCWPFQTFAGEVPIEQDLLGKVWEGMQTLSIQADPGGCTHRHHTEDFSPCKDSELGDLLLSSWVSGGQTFLIETGSHNGHTQTPKTKGEFSGLDFGQYFGATEMGPHWNLSIRLSPPVPRGWGQASQSRASSAARLGYPPPHHTIPPQRGSGQSMCIPT